MNGQLCFVLCVVFFIYFFYKKQTNKKTPILSGFYKIVFKCFDPQRANIKGNKRAHSLSVPEQGQVS